MKNILILILFIPFALSGQIPRYPFYTPTTVAEEEPPSNERVYNGTFDSADGWSTTNATWSIGSGVASYADGTTSILYQIEDDMAIAIEPSTDYTIEFDIVISSGTAYITICNSAYTNNYVAGATYANGHHSINFTTYSDIDVGGLGFRAGSASSNPFTLDNVTVVPQ